MDEKTLLPDGKPIHRVAAMVIVDKDDKILLLRRSAKCSHPGLWNFPGGSVDEGETSKEAACREAEEESSLKINVDDISFIGSVTNYNMIVNIYITKQFSNEVKINSESSEFCWAHISDLDKFSFVGASGKIHPGLIIAINKYIRRENEQH